MRVVAVLILAGLLWAAPALAPASGERDATVDETYDVWSPEGFNGFTPEGSVVNTDLRRTVVIHSPHTVVLEATYRRFRTGVSDEIRFTVYLRTSDRRRFAVHVFVDWDGRYTSASIWRGINELPLECSGLRARADFEANTLRVKIPRGCIRRPRWIRYQALAESYVEDENLWRDNALGPGPRLKTWSERIASG